MTEDDDLKPETPEEDFRARVAARLKGSGTYVDWLADQVDGELSTVIAAVLAELADPQPSLT